MEALSANREDRAFKDNLRFALDWLEKKDPALLADNSGALYLKEEGLIKIPGLGKNIILSWPGFELKSGIGKWYYLVLLHYLNRADGTPLSSEWISFSDMKDGLVRGSKYDKTSSVNLSRLYKDKDPEQILKELESLGGKAVKIRADLSVLLPFLPRFPFLLNFWFADEEFPLSAKILVSESADHFLSIEDAVTAGDILLGHLERAAEV